MKSTFIAAVALAISFGPAILAARAQRGVGDPAGVARQATKPELVSLAGKVLEVKTGPCQNTTGRSPLGTHFLMKSEDGETLNIHLGPAVQTEFIAKDLAAGKKVKVEGFRTDKMDPGHYVARTLRYGDRTVELRDENFRPVWAGNRGAGNGRAGSPAAFGPGQGRGAGYRYGLGPGACPRGGYGLQRGWRCPWGANFDGPPSRR